MAPDRLHIPIWGQYGTRLDNLPRFCPYGPILGAIWDPFGQCAKILPILAPFSFQNASVANNTGFFLN